MSEERASGIAGIVYECMNCKARVTADQLAVAPEIKCPLCLPVFEPIPALVDGSAYFGPIGQLIDEEIVRSRERKEYPDGTFCRPRRTIEVLSFNPRTFKIEYAPVTGLIRRDGESSIVRVAVGDGRISYVSPHHPMFTLAGNSILLKPASKLRPGGDFLLVAKAIPAHISKPMRHELMAEGYPPFMPEGNHPSRYNRFKDFKGSRPMPLEVLRRLRDRRSPLLEKLLKGDLHPAKVLSVDRIGYDGYYYDIEVQGKGHAFDNFMHGDAFVSHNCGYRVLRKIRPPIVKRIKAR